MIIQKHLIVYNNVQIYFLPIIYVYYFTIINPTKDKFSSFWFIISKLAYKNILCKIVRKKNKQQHILIKYVYIIREFKTFVLNLYS